MKILILGGGAGSWEIRGRQLGAALGARVLATPPTMRDWVWADVVVLVKRALPLYAAQAREAGIPVVWDALDFWRQPSENGLDDLGAQLAHGRFVGQYPPVTTIGATARQAQDLGGVYLPHHARPSLRARPVRKAIAVVAYEGQPAYLGAWAGILTRACAARGWQFVINPPNLADADLLVALRDGPWDGWMCRHWKSGVKLVNAIAAERPILTQPSAAWQEIAPPGSIVATAEDLARAFAAWESHDARLAAAETCALLAPIYQIDVLATRYRRILAEATCPITA
jgi:hypothetical protein